MPARRSLSPRNEREHSAERSESLDAALNALEAQLHPADTGETPENEGRAQGDTSDET